MMLNKFIFKYEAAHQTYQIDINDCPYP